MFEQYAGKTIRRGPRTVPIIGSLGAHVLFFAWLFAPAFLWQKPLKNPSAYQQIIKPEETKLVWYNFKRKLPEVSPATQAEERMLRAEALARQQIVSSPSEAPKADQMIYQPAKETQPENLPLPNLIALASPPPPPKKEFVPPKPLEKMQNERQPELKPAPEIQTKAMAVELPKSFLPPKPIERKTPLEQTRLMDAPQLAVAQQNATVQMPKLFLPPRPEELRRATPNTEMMDAPQISATNTGAVSKSAAFMLDQTSRVSTPYRSASKGVGNLPDAPVLAATSTSNANVAVVGLHPMEALNTALPTASSRARFSGGPKLNPSGATAPGRSTGITVPDLTVRGGEKTAAASVSAESLANAATAPTSAGRLRGSEDARRRSLPSEIVGDQRAGVPVSGAPDPRFLGRQVFTVALQSPNLTSHQGSWLMWYADRTERSYHADISAPEPLREVDPKYIATAAEERIEGIVRLAFVIAQDGHVYGVETVKKLDPRLDESAREALAQWRFSPAICEGKPVDVDALVEIPFHLAPKLPR